MSDSGSSTNTIMCKCCKTEVSTGRCICPKCGHVPNEWTEVIGFCLRNLGTSASTMNALSVDYLRNATTNWDDKAETRVERLLNEAEKCRDDQDYEYHEMRDTGNQILHFCDNGDIEIRNEQKRVTVRDTIKANPRKVRNCYYEAARIGSSQALVKLAECYLTGYGCNINVYAGIFLLTMAESAGCSDGSKGNQKAARYLVSGFGILRAVSFWKKFPSETAITALELFSRSSMLWAKYILGEMYLTGSNMVSQDVEKGKKLILEASDAEPYYVSRARKRKALLAFDKIITGHYNGEKVNNVDYAFSIMWSIKDTLIRLNTWLEIISRTTLATTQWEIRIGGIRKWMRRHLIERYKTWGRFPVSGYDAEKWPVASIGFWSDIELSQNRDKIGYYKAFDHSRGDYLLCKAMACYQKEKGVSWLTKTDKGLRNKLEKHLKNASVHSPSQVKQTIDGKDSWFSPWFLGKIGHFSSTGGWLTFRMGFNSNIRSALSVKDGDSLHFFGNSPDILDTTYWSDGFWLMTDFVRTFTSRWIAIDKKDRIVECEMESAGLTISAFIDMMGYLRRYILSDLREGVTLSDGSKQKAQHPWKQKIPINGTNISVRGELYGSVIQELKKKVGGKGENVHAGRGGPSHKSHGTFLTLGVLLGLLGVHFAYIGRWCLFLVQLALTGCGVVQLFVPSLNEHVQNWMMPFSMKLNELGWPWLGLAVQYPTLVLAGLWCLWGILFVTKDGTNHKMERSPNVNLAMYVLTFILQIWLFYRLADVKWPKTLTWGILETVGAMIILNLHFLFASQATHDKEVHWVLVLNVLLTGLAAGMNVFLPGSVITNVIGVAFVVIYLLTSFIAGKELER